MSLHECVVGMVRYSEYAELVTLKGLEKHISDAAEFNAYLASDTLLKNRKELYCKEWTLKDYADKRKSTDLTRFDYCPQCGKAIDWKSIRRKERQ